MTKTDKPKCAGRVWRGYRYLSCDKSGSREHAGKMWCAIHHPPTAQAKQDAREAAWNARHDARMARRAAQDAREAEQARKARAYDFVAGARGRELGYIVAQLASLRSSINGNTIKDAGLDTLLDLTAWVQSRSNARLDEEQAAAEKNAGGGNAVL